MEIADKNNWGETIYIWKEMGYWPTNRQAVEKDHEERTTYYLSTGRS